MTIKKSGTIALTEIGAEYADAKPHSISEFRGRLWLFKPEFKNKATAFSQFYGVKNVATLAISGTLYNYNIESKLKTFKLNGVSVVFITIQSGTRLGSTSTGAPAFRSGGNCAASGAVIHISVASNAHIVGKGGNGGGGAIGSGNGGAGTAGGEAMRFESAGRTFRITNSGVIAGGGGGGGGGGGATYCNKASKSGCTQIGRTTGQGGRAGSGLSNGANGARNKSAAKGASGGNGGAGGGWGKAGAKGGAGTGGTARGAGGSGGGAGIAVRRTTGTVTYVKTGDIRGVKQ